ncbi:hypothetical protein LTR37_003445 [Vermiconidia calcicola]|uniref:Uncharacterized protein n=1 Tax=Vermiconidia calcicola TaxID=1690605 RepID=A0ACC3NPK2_9PEZI|nr:hypothetical protein LTR37_003445 [Vermiconidia calcicola]
MDRSPLARLPAETRNQIYELALTIPDVITLEEDRVTGCWKRTTGHKYQAKNLLGLAEACEQLSRECTQLFFTVNTFELRIRDLDSRTCELKIRQFRSQIGTSNASALRLLVIRILGPGGTGIWTSGIDMAIKKLQGELVAQPEYSLSLKFNCMSGCDDLADTYCTESTTLDISELDSSWSMENDNTRLHVL